MAMRWHLKELIGRAESVTQTGISYREISAATGISTNTITQIATGKAKRADLDTVDKLLNYFGGKLGEKLTTDELLRHY
jgi:transcriptional regulator with XRE-family HTH domain